MARAAMRAGRDPAEIALLAVSKKQSIDDMIFFHELLSERARTVVFGESYVQEYRRKKSQLPADCHCHMIGPLQSNKVRDAVALFDLIESVHKPETARLISSEALRINRSMPVYFEVNISRDPDKSGFLPEDLLAFVRLELAGLSGLQVRGLMTITFDYGSPEAARADYHAMREFGFEFEQALNLSGIAYPAPLELSMGMSDDYEVAIEEGATVVRIGSALFGARQTPDLSEVEGPYTS